MGGGDAAFAVGIASCLSHRWSQTAFLGSTGGIHTEEHTNMAFLTLVRFLFLRISDLSGKMPFLRVSPKRLGLLDSEDNSE